MVLFGIVAIRAYPAPDVKLLKIRCCVTSMDVEAVQLRPIDPPASPAISKAVKAEGRLGATESMTVISTRAVELPPCPSLIV